ncbi:MAG: hypothetical protein NVS9B11_19790 [Candidatus Dormibacteraceae bacterium]
MSSFEEELVGGMAATNALLGKIENPLHRAILNHYRRHAYLEVAGRFDEIFAPDMMVRAPRYRLRIGSGQTTILEGIDQVRAFYDGVRRAGIVMWATDDEVAVADWGLASELTFHTLVPGSILAARGVDIDDPSAIYHRQNRAAFIWPFTADALLIGEHVYEDISTLRITKPETAELLTQERADELSNQLLDGYEREFRDARVQLTAHSR